MIEFNEEKHEYRVNGVVYPSVTEVLEHLTAPGFSKINPAILEEAKERGTAIHEITQDIDLGMPPEEIADYDLGYVTAYLSFLDDYAPDWELVEYRFFDEFMGYCGTIDRVGKIDGKMCVLDIKTTASPSTEQSISVCAQTAAYATNFVGDYKRYALYLHSDGTYKLLDCEDYEEQKHFSGFGVFLACFNLHSYITNTKKYKYRAKKEG